MKILIDTHVALWFLMTTKFFRKQRQIVCGMKTTELKYISQMIQS